MTSTGGPPPSTARCAPGLSLTPSSTSRTSRPRRLSWLTGCRPQRWSIQGEDILKFSRSFNKICPRWENKNSKEKQSKEEVLGAYFRLLTDAEILKLYKIYEGDFVNFGYKFNNFTGGFFVLCFSCFFFIIVTNIQCVRHSTGLLATYFISEKCFHLLLNAQIYGHLQWMVQSPSTFSQHKS